MSNFDVEYEGQEFKVRIEGGSFEVFPLHGDESDYEEGGAFDKAARALLVLWDNDPFDIIFHHLSIPPETLALVVCDYIEHALRTTGIADTHEQAYEQFLETLQTARESVFDGAADADEWENVKEEFSAFSRVALETPQNKTDKIINALVISTMLLIKAVLSAHALHSKKLVEEYAPDAPVRFSTLDAIQKILKQSKSNATLAVIISRRGSKKSAEEDKKNYIYESMWQLNRFTEVMEALDHNNPWPPLYPETPDLFKSMLQ